MAIAKAKKAAGRICGQQKDEWCPEQGPLHLQFTGQWLGGGRAELRVAWLESGKLCRKALNRKVTTRWMRVGVGVGG